MFQQPAAAAKRVLAELPGAARVSVALARAPGLTIRLAQGSETRQTTQPGSVVLSHQIDFIFKLLIF